jgi:hypothetical protein
MAKPQHKNTPQNPLEVVVRAVLQGTIDQKAAVAKAKALHEMANDHRAMKSVRLVTVNIRRRMARDRHEMKCPKMNRSRRLGIPSGLLS